MNTKHQQYDEIRTNFRSLKDAFKNLVAPKSKEPIKLETNINEDDEEVVFAILPGTKESLYDYELSIRQVHKDNETNGKNTN
tara:strand:- start:648 stop:893 length:246 start_codon:yes stop_codon:yes gene_type:complete